MMHYHPDPDEFWVGKAMGEAVQNFGIEFCSEKMVKENVLYNSDLAAQKLDNSGGKYTEKEVWGVQTLIFEFLF